MSDVSVFVQKPSKGGIRRDFRRDVQARQRVDPARPMVFTAYSGAIICDKASGYLQAEVKPGMVAIAITPLFDPVPPRRACLQSPEKLALYYVLEVIAESDALYSDDGESDHADALVLLLHEAGALLTAEQLQMAGLEPQDLLCEDQATYVNIDCFIGAINVVKGRREPGLSYLAGCLPKAVDGGGAILADLVFFFDQGQDGSEKILRPFEDVREFWSDAHLTRSKPADVLPFAKMQRLLEQKRSEKFNKKQRTADADEDSESSEIPESVLFRSV